MPFDRGPGGRPHGSPRPTSTDAADKVHAHERNRRRSREDRLRAPDVSDLTGDPSVLPEEVSDPDALSPAFIAAMEERAAAHVDGLNEQAKQAGIGLPHPQHDRATYEEYHGPVEGLDESYLSAERERLMKPIRRATRKAAEEFAGQQQFIADLYMDYRDAYGAGFSETEVAAAAARVKARYEAEGSVNALRKIAKHRDQFIDDVAVEVLSDPGTEHGDGGGHRTGGIDSSLGGGRGYGGAAPEAPESNMTEELQADQRKTGYV